MPADKPSFFVIDDDSILRTLIRGILTDAGLEHAGSASTGEEGIQGCQDKSPDLVLLDINLPGSDGIDVLARLRQLNKPPKVIMVSAEATLPRVKAATALGVDGFIVKPFNAGKLLDAVESALRY